MPKLWNATVADHRHEVREAILDATAALVAQRGIRFVTMSQIAETAGIGRATLYKYFSDIESIFIAWHDRQVTAHVEHLAAMRDHAGDDALECVLETYALMAHDQRRQHGSELAAVLHRGEHVARAHARLRDLIRDLLTERAQAGEVRRDVVPGELATYCVHALAAARDLPSKAAVRRLIEVTLGALRPRTGEGPM